MTQAILATLLLFASTLQQAPQQPPATNEWMVTFSGNALDETKVEPYTMGGGGAATIKVENGELRMHGGNESRSGIHTKEEFKGDRFIVEAELASVQAGIPQPGQTGAPIGNAVLAIMFDGEGRNRIEWILTTEGTLEAWLVRDGRGERLDNRRLGTKEKSPNLGIVRRGDTILFMINGQAGLQKAVKNLPDHFRVMLYGFGSSQDDWKSLRVVTLANP